MAEKFYCGKGKCGKYGLKLNICLDDIPIEHITVSKNGKRYARIDVNEMRSIDKYGNSHSLIVDTWKPSPRHLNTNEPKNFIEDDDTPF